MLGDILKNERIIHDELYENKEQISRIRKLTNSKHENAISFLINQVCDANFILTEEMLKIKSKEFSNTFGIYDFVPTNDCLYKFQKNNNRKLKGLSGEIGNLCEENCADANKL